MSPISMFIETIVPDLDLVLIVLVQLIVNSMISVICTQKVSFSINKIANSEKGSILGVNLLNEGVVDHAINWSGGLHHAKRTEASG